MYRVHCPDCCVVRLNDQPFRISCYSYVNICKVEKCVGVRGLGNPKFSLSGQESFSAEKVPDPTSCAEYAVLETQGFPTEQSSCLPPRETKQVSRPLPAAIPHKTKKPFGSFVLCGIAESNRSPQFGKLLFYR